MNVLIITIFISLCLSVAFLFFFFMETRQPRKKSPEQAALLPFQTDSEQSFTKKL